MSTTLSPENDPSFFTRYLQLLNGVFADFFSAQSAICGLFIYESLTEEAAVTEQDITAHFELAADGCNAIVTQIEESMPSFESDRLRSFFEEQLTYLRPLNTQLQSLETGEPTIRAAMDRGALYDSFAPGGANFYMYQAGMEATALINSLIGKLHDLVGKENAAKW